MKGTRRSLLERTGYRSRSYVSLLAVAVLGDALRAGCTIPVALSRLVLSIGRGSRAFDLAVPVMVTGGMRTLLRIADFLMVSIALGNAAVAGLELGFQYYFIPFGLALASHSGTISVVSRLSGVSGQPDRESRRQAVAVACIVLSLPLTARVGASDALPTSSPMTRPPYRRARRSRGVSMVPRFESMAAHVPTRGAPTRGRRCTSGR